MARDYIFVSYSHQDREWLDKLQLFLKPFPWGESYKDGGCLWADAHIQAGDEWRREIGDGLIRARVAVLLISPDFLASDFIAREELPSILQASERGEIIPVCVPLRSTLVDLSHPQLASLQWPRPWSEPLDALSSAEREAALAGIFRQLYAIVQREGLVDSARPSSPPRRVVDGGRPVVPVPAAGATLGKLVGVPEQRPHHIPRIQVRNRLKAALLGGGDAAAAGSAPRHVGVFGQGGLGKTVAAIDFVHDEDVRRAFPDGIYWIALGQNPNLTTLQAALISEMTGAPVAVDSVSAGSKQLRDLFATRACLLVLDDVWRFEHVRAFDVCGDRSRLLTTTRDATVLTALGAAEIELDELDEMQALALLARWTGGAVNALPPEGRTVVERCGFLPLAISVAGALVRDGTTWPDLVVALDAGNVRFLDHPYASMFPSLRLSIDALPEAERARYLELAVVPEDVAVPVSVVSRLWAHTAGMQDYETRAMLARFDRKGLLYLEGEGGTATIGFHDLQRDFLQLVTEDVRARHRQLLDAFATMLARGTAESHRTWWSLAEAEQYLWRHLAYHLVHADRTNELRHLLCDYNWIEAKLRLTDINALLSDYDPLEGDGAADLVHGALLLSAHVLSRDPRQLAGQLHGRLGHVADGEIPRLLKGAGTVRLPWLRPLTATLTHPGGPLVRTLEGHTDHVNAVAVTADDRRAVSASVDRTLKVWDLASGARIRTLEGHTGAVNGLAITRDGRRLVSGSDDRTVKVWDLASGGLLQSFEGHTRSIRRIAITPDDGRVVSASSDGTLKLWDLASGTLLRTLEGHTGWVNCVAITAGGRSAVSASGDGTLKLWDLDNGALLQTFGDHTGGVSCVAVTADGCRAVSASSDGTLKVWDLAAGTLLGTLEGHGDWVRDVAITGDGRRIVSTSDDATLKVWDLASGTLLETLEGHTSCVNGVALTANGCRAVSASDDGTLKVWDLICGVRRQPLEGHSDWVRGVAVPIHGRRVVSASDDGTLKVWDLAGALLRTLEGHTGWVSDVAVTAGADRAVSGSEDRTIKVWDLEGGALLQTLAGHAGAVSGVAVTADGRRGVSGSADGTLKVWDLTSGAVVQTLAGHTSPVSGVAVTSDGRCAVSVSGDRTLRVWDLASGAALCTLEGHADWVTSVAVTGDGCRAVSGSADTTLKVWELATGALLKTLEGHTRSVSGVALTSDGRRAVSASYDGSLKVWDVIEARAIATFTADGPMPCCGITRDGHTIIAGDALGLVHFLRLENVFDR